jgi:hypothetical protein
MPQRKENTKSGIARPTSMWLKLVRRSLGVERMRTITTAARNELAEVVSAHQVQ